MTNARKHLAERLTAILPKGWRVVPYGTDLDVLSTPVVMIQQSRIKPSNHSPLGRHSVEFTVTLIDPSQDERLAEDHLDDQIDTLLYALETFGELVWTDAQRVLFQTTYNAWEISITLDTLRKN